jgi:hypothetical protein
MWTHTIDIDLDESSWQPNHFVCMLEDKMADNDIKDSYQENSFKDFQH